MRDFCEFLESAVAQYEKSAPTVAEYLDELYRRLNAAGGADNIRLSEINAACALLENGQWEHPNYAANRIYKLMERLKMPTTGHAGF